MDFKSLKGFSGLFRAIWCTVVYRFTENLKEPSLFDSIVARQATITLGYSWIIFFVLPNKKIVRIYPLLLTCPSRRVMIRAILLALPLKEC